MKSSLIFIVDDFIFCVYFVFVFCVLCLDRTDFHGKQDGQKNHVHIEFFAVSELGRGRGRGRGALV